NPNREGTIAGFGDRQGLAVAGGRVYAAWSSNLNGGITGDGNLLLDIRVARATIAAGPRIIDGTSGQVGESGDTLNTQRPADGGPLARFLIITFDRPVDPATFTAADVRLLARDASGNPVAANLQPVVTSVVPLSATQFLVNFQPADGSNASIPG